MAPSHRPNPHSEWEEGGPHMSNGAPTGWTFSQDISPERMAEIQGLIAANGLSSGGGPVTDEAAARAAAADQAFARMVASNPTARVVGGPPASDATQADGGRIRTGGWTFSSDLSPESLAQVQGLIAANGLATDSAAATGDDDAAARAAAADEAFARMVASNPNATVIGGPAGAAQPNGGVMSVPAGAAGDGEVIVAPHGLSAAVQNGGEGGDPNSPEAEAAFAALLAANPGCTEVMPGVFMTP